MSILKIIKNYIVNIFAVLFVLLANNYAFANEKENVFLSQNCLKVELANEVSKVELGNVITENDFSNQKSYIRFGGVVCSEKVVTNAAKGSKAIVLGEGMGAVKTTAKTLQSQGINAKWYQAWSKNFPTNRLMTPTEFSAAQARNARWLNTKIKQG